MKPKNKAAQALNKIRWDKKTPEERKAHAKMMYDAKMAKKGKKIKK